jgi:hypothetical protein
LFQPCHGIAERLDLLFKFGHSVAV